MNTFTDRLQIISQQCLCGVFKSGGLELEPRGVPSVDPLGQNLLAIEGATASKIHHLEEERGQSHMITMVQYQWSL